MRRLLLHPVAPLCALSFAVALLYVGYLVAGYAPSESFDVLVAFVWGLLLAIWLVADARRSHGSVPCYDSRKNRDGKTHIFAVPFEPFTFVAQVGVFAVMILPLIAKMRAWITG